MDKDLRENHLCYMIERMVKELSEEKTMLTDILLSVGMTVFALLIVGVVVIVGK